MKDTVAWLLGEDNSSLEINLFDIWHFLYLFLILGGSLLISLLFCNKSEDKKDRLTRLFANLTIGIYIADFFLMPLSDSYGRQIAYDKLPFHICTLMGVLVPFAEYNQRLAKIKPIIVTLSIASSVMWMVYPGSALGGQPPFCYRTLQTFMFHGFLFGWGVLNLAFGKVRLNIKGIWHELCAILIITAWAAIGNTLYDNENWLFIKTSIFPFLTDEMMPPVVIFCIFGTTFLIYCAYYLVRALTSPKEGSSSSISAQIQNKGIQIITK